MIWLAALTVAGAADVWWVSSEEAADTLAAALEETWPEREVDLKVGPRPEGAVGTTWDGQILVSYGEEAVRHAEVSDPTIVALLARSWALPAGPSAPERYLPSVPAIVEIEEPPPPPPKLGNEGNKRFRLSSGLGTRGFVGQPRPLEGIRLVNELARGNVVFQSDLFLGLSLRWSGGFDPTRGDVIVTPMDRGTIGFGFGLRTQKDLALRVLVGPELRFVEEWLFFEGTAAEFAPETVLGAKLGAGVDWDIGRFALAPTAYLRASPMEPPFSGGLTVDLRYQWKR